MICWNCKEYGHNRTNCPKPKTMLAVTNVEDEPPGLEELAQEVTLNPPEKKP